MFRQWPCGCMESVVQGRVRICDAHRPEKADGYGGMEHTSPLKGKVRYYPANGEAVDGWTGR